MKCCAPVILQGVKMYAHVLLLIHKEKGLHPPDNNRLSAMLSNIIYKCIIADFRSIYHRKTCEWDLRYMYMEP